VSKLIRFGVSLDKNLLEKFDLHIKNKHYHNRSNAIADLIREDLIREEWISEKEITGAILLVFDHHTRDLSNKLTEIQHEYHELIISSQHIHLDHDNCFEIIIVHGKSLQLYELCNKLKVEKGVKHTTLSLATTGRDV